MSIYIKGAIVAVLVMAGILFWYNRNVDSFAVNKTPPEFDIITKMENEGAQDFALQRLDGTELKLSDFKGKVVILNFWASWCNPCVEEFPSMLKLVERMKDVVVVAVSTDETREDVETFVKAFGLPKPGFEVVWDKDKKVMESYGVKKIPESFIIGTNFKLVRKILGVENWASDDAVSYFDLLKQGAVLKGQGSPRGANPHGHMGGAPADADAAGAAPAASGGASAGEVGK